MIVVMGTGVGGRGGGDGLAISMHDSQLLDRSERALQRLDAIENVLVWYIGL